MGETDPGWLVAGSWYDWKWLAEGSREFRLSTSVAYDYFLSGVDIYVSILLS